MKLASQLRGDILPIMKQKTHVRVREITSNMKKFDVYCHLRRVRIDKRLKGKREKKAQDAALDGIGK